MMTEMIISVYTSCCTDALINVAAGTMRKNDICTHDCMAMIKGLEMPKTGLLRSTALVTYLMLFTESVFVFIETDESLQIEHQEYSKIYEFEVCIPNSEFKSVSVNLSHRYEKNIE